jgi:hypothetical protein
LANPELFADSKYGAHDYASLKDSNLPRPQASTYYSTRLKQLHFRRNREYIFFAAIASVNRSIQAGVYSCTQTGKAMGMFT